MESPALLRGLWSKGMLRERWCVPESGKLVIDDADGSMEFVDLALGGRCRTDALVASRSDGLEVSELGQQFLSLSAEPLDLCANIRFAVLGKWKAHRVTPFIKYWISVRIMAASPMHCQSF